MLLNDGTIVPSYLRCQDTVNYPQPSEAWNNFGLRMGMVKDIIYPTDGRSVSKKFIEYSVECQYRDSYGRPSTIEIPHAFQNNAFGGLADSLHFTYRKDDGGQSHDGIGLGSKVLLLCINGELNNAVIVGGVRDHQDTVDADEGHRLDFKFNGVQATIASDGGFTLARRGPTNARGVSDSGDAAQTFFMLDPDGSLSLRNQNESITIDHPGQDIRMQAFDHIDINGQSGVSIFTSHPASEISVSASGKIILTSQIGVMIGSGLATDALMMGTKYRTAEQVLHSALVAGLTGLATQLGIAGVSLTVAAPMMLFPIVGPMAASVPIGAAGVTLLSAVTNITAMITAINAFEGMSLTYLSMKNKTD